jgi:hypothetical protein
MKILGCFLIVTLVLAVVPLRADNDLTLFGAGQHQGKLNLQTATNTATTVSNFNPGTFGTYGIRYGHGGIVGFEQTLAYTPHFMDPNTKGFISNSDLMITVPVPKVKPYATVGPGFIFTWGTDESGQPSLAKIGNKFALNYGGGVKVMPGGPVGLRFDIRGYLIPNAVFNLPIAAIGNPLGALGSVQTQSQNINVLEVGVGVIFVFGGKK